MNMPRPVCRSFAVAVCGLLIAGCNAAREPGVQPDARFKQGAADDVDAVQAMPTLSNTDPCAMRLHDLCGALLLYSFEHNGALPARLEELSASPSGEPLAFACPVSHRPYVYAEDGIRILDSRKRVIVYDAAPSHAGVRWAVVIDEPQPDKPLVTDVRPFPESFFTLRPPAVTP